MASNLILNVLFKIKIEPANDAIVIFFYCSNVSYDRGINHNLKTSNIQTLQKIDLPQFHFPYFI